MTPRANPMNNKSSAAQNHSAATEYDTTSVVLSEDLDAVDLNSSKTGNSNSQPATPPPATVLKAPLPLGWD